MRAKPGRKGINELMTPNLNGEVSRVIAPASMTPSAKKLFNEIVNACAPDHFRDYEIPLLASYVTTTLMARATAKYKKQFAIFERAARLQKTLATSLRLSPSTRLHPEKLARQGNKHGGRNAPPPWDHDDDDQHTTN